MRNLNRDNLNLATRNVRLPFVGHVCSSFGRIFGQALICAVVVVATLLAGNAVAQDKTKLTFDEHVKPIFQSRCSSCHNQDKKKGDLDVMNYGALMEGGSSGSVIEPSDPDSSYLLSLVTHDDTPVMPPSGTKIPDAEIATITKWIEMGALENSGSKARKAKPKFDMAMSGDAMAKPEVMPLPMRMPLEPALRVPRTSAVTAMATSPWAPIVAISAPQQILLYNTTSLQLVGVMPLQSGQQATAINFSANGSLLVAAVGKQGAGGKVQVWNVLTGELVTTVGDELDSILAADISPDHTMVALGGPQRMVRVYYTGDGSLAYQIKKHTDWVTALGFSPDGKYLATGDRNGGLHTWEADTGNEHLTLRAHTASVTAVSWRSDGKILASGGEDSNVRLWELENGKQIKNWGAHGGGVTGIEFSRDGKIVTCGRDKVARSYGQDGKAIKSYAGFADSLISSVSFCDESRRLIAGDWTGQIRVFQLDDAKHVGNLDPNPPKLADRLAAAQEGLAKAQGAAQPLAVQTQATQAKLTELAGSLAGAQKTQQETSVKMNAVGKQLATAKQQFESTKNQQEAWRREQGQKKQARPLIADSHSKAVEASKTLPKDADLKRSAENMAAKVKQIDQRLNELNGLVTKSDAEKMNAKQQMDASTKEQQQLQATMKQLAGEVTRLQKEVGQLTEQVKKEKAESDAANVAVVQAQQQVDRWQREVEFIRVLAELKTQKISAAQAVQEHDQAVNAAKQKLAEVQSQVNNASQTKAAAQQQVQAIEQKIKELKSQK